MKKVIWIVLMIVLAFPVGMASAQEPGTKEDNACNEGGSMAGKCDTPWEWVCGYYLARWEAAGGWNTPNNLLNDACASLLPPQPDLASTTFQPVCFNFTFLADQVVLCWYGDFFTDDRSTLPKNPDYEYIFINPLIVCPPPYTFAGTVGVAPVDFQNAFNAFGYDDALRICYRNL